MICRLRLTLFYGKLTCLNPVHGNVPYLCSLKTRGEYWFNSLAKRSRKNPAYIYQLKVNNRNSRKKCEICSKLKIKTYFTPCFSVSIVDFE